MTLNGCIFLGVLAFVTSSKVCSRVFSFFAVSILCLFYSVQVYPMDGLYKKKEMFKSLEQKNNNKEYVTN